MAASDGMSDFEIMRLLTTNINTTKKVTSSVVKEIQENSLQENSVKFMRRG